MSSETQNIQVDASRNSVTVAVNPSVYSLDIVYGASFVYIDRAFVLLDRGDEDHVAVCLTAREASDEGQLLALGGEFANELLTQALRETIAKKTQKVRELIINRALYSTLDSGGAGDVGLDEDDDLEFLDDPLGIAVPWEEKYEGEAKGDETADSATLAGDEAAEADKKDE